MQQQHERIVITGMGTVSPLGLSVAETWQNAAAGYPV
jgi:3-oxoacyl-(acyl-carrier-protein) synthase